MADNNEEQPKFKGITVAEFDKLWQKAKKELGNRPDAKVMITTPYEKGIGWRYEYAINCDAYGGNIDIAITLNYQTDAERNAETAKKWKESQPTAE